MKRDVLIRLALIIPIFIAVYLFGIKPYFADSNFYPASSKDDTWTTLKLEKDEGIYDVIVIGGEPDGIAAAVSSAKMGAKTLLISEGDRLGGIISSCLITDIEASRGQNGKNANKNILSDLLAKSNSIFSIKNYESGIGDLVKNQKNLEVVYQAKINSPVLNGNTLIGVNISTKNLQNKAYIGKRIIDATIDGKVLEMCKVPYFSGSEDLRLSNSYEPIRFNFEIEGIDWSNTEKKSGSFDKYLQTVYKYDPSSPDIRLSNFAITDQGGGKAIVQGIEICGLNVMDKQALNVAYKSAVKEAGAFTNYLKVQFNELKNIRIIKVADSLYIKESKHFRGEYMLSVNDILENKDFDNKIALGSYPVESDKLASNNNSYIIGKPVQYGIPLGCIIPLNIDNLLMTGNKISYSSLASTSAATLDVGVETGEAAGIAAVYSIAENITPRNILNSKNSNSMEKLQELLKKEGLNLPKFSIKTNYMSNWSYPAVRQLNTLGLIAGGVTNNYLFDSEAKQKDLATLLINGSYRLSPDKYTLDLDARLKPYFNEDKLTKESAAEMLSVFHGVQFDRSNAFRSACDSGYINNLMELKLKDKKILTMEDVYYLSVYNIKLLTGKDIKD